MLLTYIQKERFRLFMKAIAIIPARGGSKRIPHKNIKPFLGKPIIEYSICAARESGIFDEIMVSTDDEAIADIARKAGAKVPFMRSTHASSDYATTRDVLEEVLWQYKKNGHLFQVMCCIYPTAPFVTENKLRRAYSVMREKNASSVLPVVKFSYPPQRAFVIREGKLEYQYPQYKLERSQDLEPIYHDAGQFYFYRLDADLNFNDDMFIPFVCSETEVQDIDNEEDWEIAEQKYVKWISKNSIASV